MDYLISMLTPFEFAEEVVAQPAYMAMYFATWRVCICDSAVKILQG
jgi:hypothetical protein